MKIPKRLQYRRGKNGLFIQKLLGSCKVRVSNSLTLGKEILKLIRVQLRLWASLFKMSNMGSMF
jgi:hypothetical protein